MGDKYGDDVLGGNDHRGDELVGDSEEMMTKGRRLV